jgi:hypothetical protein
MQMLGKPTSRELISNGWEQWLLQKTGWGYQMHGTRQHQWRNQGLFQVGKLAQIPQLWRLLNPMSIQHYLRSLIPKLLVHVEWGFGFLMAQEDTEGF